MNTEQKLVIVEEVAGELQAEMLRGLLKAQDIPVMLSEESAARAIGITIPALGKVQIIVPAEFAEAARQLIADYNAGKLEELGNYNGDSDDEEDQA